MTFFNRLFNGLFDLLMMPFHGNSPWPGIIWASLLTAGVLVALFAVSSNPAGIRRTRNRFLARTLELLLFQHDLRVSLTACGRLLAANLAYFLQFLKPMAVGLLPLVVMFVQMESWFDRRPLKLNQPAVLTVTLAAEQDVSQSIPELRLSDGTRIDAPPVRLPSAQGVSWRIVPTVAGPGWADVTVAGVTERKSVVAGDQVRRLSRRREVSGLFREFFAPSEPPLAAGSPVRTMELAYPPRDLTLGLTTIPWVLAAFVLVMIFSLLLGQLFGVRIA